MNKNKHSGLLTKNKLGTILGTSLQDQHYLEVVKAFARLTYESIYLIDYSDMSFEYVSENPLFLCGLTAAEVLQMGYEFYFRHVPEQDLELLTLINEAGFDFYARVPEQERTLYSISYDFHLISKEGSHTLINHKLTPLFLTTEGKLWKAMCIVSLSRHQTAGNVHIHKQRSDNIWELLPEKKTWQQLKKPSLSGRETEVLRLYAQGLSISQIASKIFVATDTVKYYRRRIFERLEVSNIEDALARAISNKLI